ERPTGEGEWRDIDRHHEVTVRERVLEVRSVAGEEEEVVDRNAALAGASLGVYHGIECDERHGQVGRMRGDAAFARAEDRVTAVDAVERGAAGSRLALVARR